MWMWVESVECMWTCVVALAVGQTCSTFPIGQPRHRPSGVQLRLTEVEASDAIGVIL